ncbi:SubName: Full=Uncharacterized protein {ECO:0000313/EMBL:CCA73124.1} [Serendipita indica DSM 11827]|nr:SubName: Full=Uncharacterized protein {ECO:0000313/EMBL:CCA73124.1} [Serendipita indica DSM 11827]
MDLIRRRSAPRTNSLESAQEKGATVETVEEVKINPPRKFSTKWMRQTWDNAVERGKWPRIGYIALGLVIVAAWTAIMVGFAHDEVFWATVNMEGSAGGKSVNKSEHDLYIKGTLKRFDPVERNLRISWSMVYVGNDNKTFLPLGDRNESATLNVYRDVNATKEDRPIPEQYQEFQNSLWRVDNITLAPIAVLGMHTSDSVDTQIDFTQAEPGSPWRQPLYGYPFDVWTGSITFVFTDRIFAGELNLTNSAVVAVQEQSLLTVLVLNWRISYTDKLNCDVDDPGCELQIDFTGRRPGLVIFATIIAVIVNWLTTIGIFFLTAEAVIMRRYYIISDTDLLGVAVTGIFALPGLRAILPGAPDFGAIIDLIGILPNVGHHRFFVHGYYCGLQGLQEEAE